ncbi:MAG: class IV adenylate cyclase [Desulfovibrionales bacterium]
MHLEQETKFSGVSFDALRKNLDRLNARQGEMYFEENVVYDTPQRDLNAKEILLRLRKGRRNLLTVKRAPERQDGGAQFKEREEIETEVENFQALQEILTFLGFCPVFRYEKFREIWFLGECHICLDILPFGEFVEIEGRPGTIFECCRLLGLDPSGGSPKSYYQLHQEYLQSNGLPFQESFVFGIEERMRLKARAGR